MKWFSFEELERSDTAKRYAIDNRIPDRLRGNAAALVDNALDPLREAWGKPIRVTSGYRCEELNRRVGGSRTSQHLAAEAADITTGNRVENRELFELAKRMELPFDQLIWEKGNGTGPDWIHISYNPMRNRRQILKL